MAQASLYTLSITQRPRLALLLAGVLAALFGLLYVVLRLESYALLAGHGDAVRHPVGGHGRGHGGWTGAGA